MNKDQKNKIVDKLAGAYAALDILLKENDPELKAIELETLAAETLERITEITRRLCLNGTKSFMRGWPVVYDGLNFRYVDTGAIARADLQDSRPCVRCGRPPTPEGHDACLGELEGVVSACCGHGKEESYRVNESERVSLQATSQRMSSWKLRRVKKNEEVSHE